MAEYNPTHDQLVERAEKWLNSVGCKVVIRDPFRSYNKEQPDAIGWRSGVSILVECKVTRWDFLADKYKSFRCRPDEGMGDWRVYFAPKGIIKPDEIGDKWSLVEVTEKKCFRVAGLPKGNVWTPAPIKRSNKRAETIMLVSALRRLQIRGYLPEIYDGLPTPTT